MGIELFLLGLDLGLVMITSYGLRVIFVDGQQRGCFEIKTEIKNMKIGFKNKKKHRSLAVTA